MTLEFLPGNKHSWNDKYRRRELNEAPPNGQSSFAKFNKSQALFTRLLLRNAKPVNMNVFPAHFTPVTAFDYRVRMGVGPKLRGISRQTKTKS